MALSRLSLLRSTDLTEMSPNGRNLQPGLLLPSPAGLKTLLTVPMTSVRLSP